MDLLTDLLTEFDYTDGLQWLYSYVHHSKQSKVPPDQSVLCECIETLPFSHHFRSTGPTKDLITQSLEFWGTGREFPLLS